MAGLFYLPRLFVYHVEATPGGELATTLETMEQRLLRYIMNPAMLATWALGLWAAVQGGYFSEGWLHAKLVLVIAMTGFHMFLARWRRQFAAGANEHTEKFYRIINEVPTVLLVGIVFLAVLRPF
ncbi:MAG: protoporphyrinogen oxidase HemJ [Pseudomonadota bacterium]